jgi:hypothetical protein
LCSLEQWTGSELEAGRKPNRRTLAKLLRGWK